MTVAPPFDNRVALLRLAVERPGAMPHEVNDQPWMEGRRIPNNSRAALVFCLRAVGFLEPAEGRGKNTRGLYATEDGRQALSADPPTVGRVCNAWEAARHRARRARWNARWSST